MDKLSTRVLNWVNECRRQCQRPPLEALPQGIQRMAGRCPVGKGLGGWAHTHRCQVWANGRLHTYDTPDFVSQFITAFDRGRYPDLIDPSPGGEQ